MENPALRAQVLNIKKLYMPTLFLQVPSNVGFALSALGSVRRT